MRSVILGKDGKFVVSTTAEKPAAQAKYVLVAVRAFAINRQDLIPGDKDKGVGLEAVGTVEDAGGVKGLRVGATVAVLGPVEDGLWKDFVSVPARYVVPLRVTPPTLGSPLDSATFAKLAAIPYTFITAFGILDALDLRRNDRLLIRGGTTSIGLATATIAKSLGAVVAATTRDPTKAPHLSDNGSDFVILEREGGVKDDVRMMFATKDTFSSTEDLATPVPGNGPVIDTAGADKCVDFTGLANLPDSLQALKAPGGFLCLAGTLGDSSSTTSFNPITSMPSGTYLTNFIVDRVDLGRVPLQEIVDRVLDRSEYRLNLDRTFSLNEIEKATDYVKNNQARGKVVIIVPPAEHSTSPS
ncbi:hypothetical protein DFS34DRAFT_574907 [Phlyctochytrium arcticum]|nr:hypothetical protein DFS34DRAFT_574907 [Phlyctochytrium arcticum]